VIAVLAGGVGAARFLRGLVQVVPPAEVTALVNTADDTVIHGLAVSPDLDTVTYTLAGAIDPGRGWGLVDESWRAMAALARYEAVRPAGSAAATTWFNLGDQDLATHLYRTARLAEGATLSEVTREIAAAWGVEVTLAPMTDDRVETRLSTAIGELSFQEYFVQHRHTVAVHEVRYLGAERATPNGLDLLRNADTIVIAPSNPILSIGPLRALAGVDDVLTSRREQVVAVSPIVAGAALKGPADRMLSELGHDASVVGVARLYAPIAATLVIDDADADLAPAVEAAGMHAIVTPTVMTTPAIAADLARVTLTATGREAA
jgi:LPPG:FO 2-phospho-L-lactate transferase